MDPRKDRNLFGNPAVSMKPVAFRPCLTTGLALSLYFGNALFSLPISLSAQTDIPLKFGELYT